jgi:hypothetical protein
MASARKARSVRQLPAGDGDRAASEEALVKLYWSRHRQAFGVVGLEETLEIFRSSQLSAAAFLYRFEGKRSDGRDPAPDDD